jgi:cyclophilin family peptidyl-prolyl cis-trans isomerase
MANPVVYFDISIGGAGAISRLTFELFADAVPRTVENFRALCTGERGYGQSGKPLTFSGSVLHRIIPGFASPGRVCHSVKISTKCAQRHIQS